MQHGKKKIILDLGFWISLFFFAPVDFRLDFGFLSLDFGVWRGVLDSWILDLDFGFWSLGFGLWILGFWIWIVCHGLDCA